MDLRIDKPEWCNDCVFGEERGCFCSLLNGELCYKHGDYEKHRPDWCPFDNDGKTITADGVTLLKEQEAKHGKWLKSKILEDCLWVCSECEFPSEAFAAPMIYKYCPNCGVKMDRR